MAASLVKSMSRLALQRLPGSTALRNVQPHSSFSWWAKSPSLKSVFTSGVKAKSLPTAHCNDPLATRLLPSSDMNTTATRSVTYEIKQWREHRVVNRFYRLHWGAWIRCKGGRNKKLYKKSAKTRWVVRQHIFCNRRQNKRLDRLVTPSWREPKYYVDSPYELYHHRTNFSQFPQRRKFYP